MLIVEPVLSERDVEELDHLLWETLWKPIGLPQGIKKTFELSGTILNIVAKDNDVIIGGLVAVWTSASEVEIRHIAVAVCSQKIGVGEKLINSLLEIVSSQDCSRIHTIARNTSTSFFIKR